MIATCCTFACQRRSSNGRGNCRCGFYKDAEFEDDEDEDTNDFEDYKVTADDYDYQYLELLAVMKNNTSGVVHNKKVDVLFFLTLTHTLLHTK